MIKSINFSIIYDCRFFFVINILKLLNSVFLSQINACDFSKKNKSTEL